MPEDGLLTDFHHRLGLELRFLPDARAQPAAEENNRAFPDLFHTLPDHTLYDDCPAPGSFSAGARLTCTATSILAIGMKLKQRLRKMYCLTFADERRKQ